MFSATRLHAFVCLALGIAVSAAPAGSLGSNVARSPDLYDLTGGIGALLFGEPEGYSAGGEEDAYILKRQLAGLDIGSRLGSNLGIQHAAALAAGAGLTPNVSPVDSVPKRDLYDLTGGVGALLFGGDIEGGEESDEYILKRQSANLDIGSRLGSNLGIQHATALATGAGLTTDSVLKRDLYDLTGGIGALLFGGDIEGGEGSDEYILKRQLAGLDLGSRLGSNLGIQHAAALAAGAGLTTDAVPVGSIPKRDLYDLTGGVGALLFGGDVEGGEDSDEYILKRQLAGLDIGSRLGSNVGLQHAASLAAGAGLTADTMPVDFMPKRDLYDLTGGVGALLFGGDIEGAEDSDEYILKRQLAGLDIGSRLGSNLGIQHATALATGAGLTSNIPADSILKRDLYDLTGGIGALLFGGDIEGGEGSDEYILKREDAGNVAARSPDVYDLTGGLGALLFGVPEEYGGDGDEDVYVLKRTS